jgi:putative PIN family toxin of toxin-antitoxin system
MPKAVFDSTVLVSTFLTPRGVSSQLLRLARQGAFTMSLSEDLLNEIQETLLEDEDLRARFPYSDRDVHAFMTKLKRAVQPVPHPPVVKGVCRDPEDDMVIACALGAGAQYLVTRDKDLLTLKAYQGVTMIRPEQFMHVIRQQLPPPGKT